MITLNDVGAADTINKERTPHRDVPYTVGRLITTEDQSLKQQDALPCYLFCRCKVNTKNC